MAKVNFQIIFLSLTINIFSTVILEFFVKTGNGLSLYLQKVKSLSSVSTPTTSDPLTLNI